MFRTTVFASFLALTVASAIQAAAPQLINYQGFLTESAPPNNPVNGTFDITFTIYDDSAGRNIIWTETQIGVEVDVGNFSALLGSVTPLVDTVFNDTTRYLGIKVGADPELAPRSRLVSMAYSFRTSTVDGATGGIISGDVSIQSDLTVSGKATIGPGHTNTSANGFVAGANNIANNTSATVGGGRYNMARGDYSVVAGGGGDNPTDSNSALGPRSTIGGGFRNSANGNSSTIGGGVSNIASEAYATIAGGRENTASEQYSTVAGGGGNIASDIYATVGGGRANTANFQYATVSGGDTNSANSFLGTIGGGGTNTVSGSAATIGGGFENTVSGQYGTLSGGWGSFVFGNSATVSGGKSNVTDNQYATVSGGWTNTASGLASTIGGGENNLASNQYATVGGGWTNEVFGLASTIGGGENNLANSPYSTVGGGIRNLATASHSTVSGGKDNGATGAYATVGGGQSNQASGEFSSVPGGLSNTANGKYSFAAGRRAYAQHDGSFVWADSTNATFFSTTPNQFLIRADFVGIGRNTRITPSEYFGVHTPATAGFGGMYMSTAGSTARPFYGYATAGSVVGAYHYYDGSTNKWILNLSGDRLVVTNLGDVGIGTNSPNFKLDVRGTIGNNATLFHSDVRWKKNIETIQDALGKVKQLRGVNFEWKGEEFTDMNFQKGKRIGLIAQEVEKVLPELVNTAPDGYKSVEYANLVAILIEAIKQQQKQIDELKDIVNKSVSAP